MIRFPQATTPYFSTPKSPMLEAELKSLLPKPLRLPPEDNPRLPAQLKADTLNFTTKA